MHACKRCTPWEIHTVEMHAYEIPAYEMHAWEMHAYEIPAYEMYAWEMYACRDARL
jgi:hypothetical protein